MLHEWSVQPDTTRPNVNEMVDFNIVTMNGKVMPATEPLVARQGDTVWVRFGNLSAMNHHPIHLHGHAFKIIGTDGGWAEKRAELVPETTVLVPVGTARVIEFVADNPGDWLFHCHMTHHTMNQMGHASPLMLGVDTEGVDEIIRELIPGYMSMGITGMEDMTRTDMPLPENSIPMRGAKFQFGRSVMGGMATILRVREDIETYEDPGPYEFPEGTVAREATVEEMQRDGIEAEHPPVMDGQKDPMPHDHPMEHDE